MNEAEYFQQAIEADATEALDTIKCPSCRGQGWHWNVDAGFRCQRCNGTGYVAKPAAAELSKNQPEVDSPAWNAGDTVWHDLYGEGNISAFFDLAGESRALVMFGAGKTGVALAELQRESPADVRAERDEQAVRIRELEDELTEHKRVQVALQTINSYSEDAAAFKTWKEIVTGLEGLADELQAKHLRAAASVMPGATTATGDSE